MAIELAYDEAYATPAEADAFLPNDSVWLALTDAVKSDALLWARYYLDENWDCALSTLTDIPDELKYANSLLASDYDSQGSLYPSSGTTTGLKKNKVVAGDVETEKEYYEGAVIEIKPNSYNKVKGLLAPLCSSLSSSGTVSIVRA